MKNQVDYSLYKCPYAHLEKECGHELKGPEGHENTYSVWCACGFRGPVFYFTPEELKLKKLEVIMDKEKLRELVNDRYRVRKAEKGFIGRYSAPEVIKDVQVRSDQVNALIDVIADILEEINPTVS